MVRSVYPVLMTEKLKESCLFYKTYFSFTEAFANDWYISLVHLDGGELAFINARHETVPQAYRGIVKGMMLNIEVENATRMYNNIMEKTEKIVLMPLRDEDYGQRHFMLQDPNGIIIDVIEAIPPSKEFQDSYILE